MTHINKITNKHTIHTSINLELHEKLYGDEYQKLSNQAQDIVLKHDKFNLSEKDTFKIYLENRSEIIKSVSGILPYAYEEEEFDKTSRHNIEKIMTHVLDIIAKPEKSSFQPFFIGINFEMENY